MTATTEALTIAETSTVVPEGPPLLFPNYFEAPFGFDTHRVDDVTSVDFAVSPAGTALGAPSATYTDSESNPRIVAFSYEGSARGSFIIFEGEDDGLVDIDGTKEGPSAPGDPSAPVYTRVAVGDHTGLREQSDRALTLYLKVNGLLIRIFGFTDGFDSDSALAVGVDYLKAF